MQFCVVFTKLGAFVVYDGAVAFCAVFVNEVAAAGCIVLSDGFASV